MSASEPTAPEVRTEADVDARVVIPYITSLGIHPNQLRAQRSFSLRLGRNMIHNEGCRQVQTGRLDYLVTTEDGRPLFIVELKAPEEELTEDDWEQGISYARLTHPITPLVLVTNTRDTLLYDTITKDRLTSADGATLIRGKGRLSAEEDLRVRAEALECFIGYSSENVATFSKLQRANRMRALRGGDGLHARKYEPDLYLPRRAVRDAVGAFLASPASVFALGGRSGYGKTNEMCSLAEELGQSHVTLFFNGAELFGSLGRVLTDEFNWFFSDELALPGICQRLARLADRSGRPVLILLDAVDEAGIPDLPQELSDLVGRLDQFDGRIRLLVSSKPEEWPRFARLRGNPAPIQDRLFRLPGAAPSEQALGDLAPPDDAPPMSVVVEPFGPAERAEAVHLYTAAFGLDGQWPPAMNELVTDPFMLRMVAEVASATGEIPSDPGEWELVRRYVDQKLARTSEPRRARLELSAVAKGLAASGGRPDEWGEDGRRARAGRRTPGPPSVAEAAVRAEAGLPATAPVADELVAFGVLVRSTDRDGRTTLAFTYDRVRDYMLATHVYGLPSLDRAGFRDAALACLSQGPGAAALRWYLPFVTAEQWEGFVEAATKRVERLLDAYEGIRSHLAAGIRLAIEPRSTEPVGAVFAGSPQHGWFELAFFRRTSEALPRACHDPAIFENWRRLDAAGVIPKLLLSSARGRAGFWFLRDPERYAADHIRAQLLDVIKEGRLVESVDEYLLAERVVALAQGHRRELGLPDGLRGGPGLFADHFVGLNLFPLDLVDLRRRVQMQLAFESYQAEHMDQRLQEVRRAHEAAGRVPEVITASSAWTPDDIKAWRELAISEVNGGRDFTEAGTADSELRALGRALNALLDRRDRLEEPLLPPPDLRDPLSIPGQHNFEDGYSDAQLARLLESIFGRARAAYEKVMAASFSEPFRALLDQPPPLPGVLCFRRPSTDRPNPQFGAVIEEGAASLLEGSIEPRDGAVAAVVHPGGPTKVERTGEQGFETIVRTRSGTFMLQVKRMPGIWVIVWPHDAPPFVRDGSAGRLAPVRARVYYLAKKALEKLSVEDLLTLTTTGQRKGSLLQSGSA